MQIRSIVTGLALFAGAVSALDKPLNIQKDVEKGCPKEEQSKEGDLIYVHYKGTLEDGTKFDASYDRGDPLSFNVGRGQVIKGWEQGLLDMCVGDKRTLTIQPEWAYGSQAMGPIPANSVLIFETEMVSIGGPPKKDEL
ncbi:FKBP-type peptidyl-prolyl cis-trans isomerase-like protein 2 [Elsinoe fawcettii]|nr:FKBP-type peptidyl-prolyl cis-trans isomerase-like protein 2 [Elsinoe fawcettii]